MAKPFDSRLQQPYTEASKMVRAMDQLDGGPEPVAEAIVTACFALEAGLITAKLTDGQNSCFDALVMLHEIRERLGARTQEGWNMNGSKPRIW